jgi:hypothetical protein
MCFLAYDFFTSFTFQGPFTLGNITDLIYLIHVYPFFAINYILNYIQKFPTDNTPPTKGHPSY